MHRKISGEDIVSLHEFLGKNLASLQLGSPAGRTEHFDPRAPQLVRDPLHQGHLGPDHHQIHFFIEGQLDLSIHVSGRHRLTSDPLDAGDSMTPRGDDNFLDQGAAGNLPSQGMFPTTAAHDQNLHCPPPLFPVSILNSGRVLAMNTS